MRRLLLPLSRLGVLVGALLLGLASQARAGAVVTNYPLTGRSVLTVDFYDVSPDGQYVVFRRSSPSEIYSVPITGSDAPVLLSGSPGFFVVSPTSQHVVYTAYVSGVTGLYSVPITGGQPTKLNGPFGHTQGVSFGAVQITPDGDRVIYRADQDTDEVYELYSVALNGAGGVKLNAALGGTEDVDLEYRISPDSRRIVYRGGATVYGVPAAGGSALPFIPSPETARVTFYPDSSVVFYSARASAGQPYQLYRGPAPGGSATVVSASLPAGSSLVSYLLDPVGAQAVCRITSPGEALYRLSLTDGGVTPLSNAALDGRGLGYFALSGDGQFVIYQAANGLFSVRLMDGAVSPLSAAPSPT